jgi:hypothetical protein
MIKVQRCARIKVRFMVSEGKRCLFKRKDGKFLIYLPKDLAEDSMFPFKGSDSIFVKISSKLGDNKLTVEKWKSQNKKRSFK